MITFVSKCLTLQISAYCSQDAIRYAEQMPNFYQLASYPDKISSGYDN